MRAVCRWAVLVLAFVWAAGEAPPLASHPQDSTPRIEWRVRTPFSPFSGLANPDAASARWLPTHDTTGALESFQQWYLRIANAGESPFAEHLGSDRNPWDPSAGRYRPEYARPSNVLILARAVGAGPECRWVVTSGEGQTQATRVSACDAWVELVSPLAGARLSVAAGGFADSTGVAIEHKVVVAIGDSYGSGEGNPDVPTKWKPLAAERNSYSWLSDPDKKQSLIQAGARWWDTKCHRSFWSHQTYIAMGLAAENSRRLVTYLHYSCSAAEIFDGLMVTQFEPPGRDKECKSSPFHNGRRVKGCYVPTSQVAAVVTDLCQGTVVRSSPAIAEMAGAVHEAATAKSAKLDFMDTYKRVGVDLAECPDGYRVPDLVLLSIGGNDIGFGALAGWAIVPPEARNWFAKFFGVYRAVRGTKVTCPEKSIQSGCRKPYDYHLIRQLPHRFALLSRALRQFVKADPATVVVTSYPDPLRDRNRMVCGDPKGTQPRSPWAGAHRQVPFGRKNWDFNILKGEAAILSDHTLPNFRRTLEESVTEADFTFVGQTADAFIGHCWTEADAGDLPTALPSADPIAWRCEGLPEGSPACWRPFAPARRYIRTVNDALLTQSSERDDDMTGAVHPTAQGHAAIADVVSTLLRAKGRR